MRRLIIQFLPACLAIIAMAICTGREFQPRIVGSTEAMKIFGSQTQCRNPYTCDFCSSSCGITKRYPNCPKAGNGYDTSQVSCVEGSNCMYLATSGAGCGTTE